MSKQIHNFFQGNLSITEGYRDTIFPVFLKSLNSNHISEGKSIAELETAAISYSNSSSDHNDIENTAKVVIINFIGPVVKYADWWMDMLGTQEYMKILDRYKNDPSYAGAVLNMDTGGGQLYGTPEFYDYISAFEKVKPIGIYTNGLLCSGGYYIAAPATFIMANKRANAIGSIGMYAEVFDWNGYYESIGLKVHLIYSSLSPEKNKAHREVIDGSDKNYKNYISKEINPDCKIFIDDMKIVRPQIKEEVFDGGVWNGEQALEMGLIDYNGTLQDAVDKVYEIALERASNNNENPNNLINNNMSKKKAFLNIQQVIGVEGDGLTIQEKGFLSSKEGVFIEESQLDALEATLSGHDAALVAEKGKVTTAESNLNIANTKVTTMETAINTAITSAGLDADVAAGATIDQKIALLSAKVIEYGKASGKGVKPHAEGDRQDPENEIVNKDDAHNAAYENA